VETLDSVIKQLPDPDRQPPRRLSALSPLTLSHSVASGDGDIGMVAACEQGA